MGQDDDMTIATAVCDADLRVLTMCLFQITGDRKWLSEPYLPKRDVRLVAPEDAGFSDEVAAERQQLAQPRGFVQNLREADPQDSDPGIFRHHFALHGDDTG